MYEKRFGITQIITTGLGSNTWIYASESVSFFTLALIIIVLIKTIEVYLHWVE